MTLIVSAVALAPQMQLRPQLFTFMMLSVMMTIVALEVYRGGTTLWPLIPMFALRANLHGGYAIGVAAMGITTVTMFVQGWLGDAKRLRSARRLALITAGCAVVTILNPFGVGLWTGVAHSVSDPLIRQLVNDWMPLPQALIDNWRESKLEILGDVAPLLLFASFIAAIAMAPERDDAALVVIATVFIGSAFYAARNVALAVIALAIPLARHAGLAFERGARRPARIDEPVAALLAIGALAIAIVGGTFSNRLRTWKPVPYGAVGFMERHGLRGKILNQYEWGGYLTWHLGLGSKVFVDGRCELVYPDKLIQDYAVFFFGMETGRDVLGEFPHDFVLIGPHTKGAEVVRKDPRWHLLYSDQTAALFGRNAIAVEATGAGNVSGIDVKTTDTYFP